MAASAFIENGEITEIYFTFGNFRNDQRKKFIHAPFCITKLLGEEYIMPTPVGGTAEDLKGLFGTDAVTTEQIMGGFDFGFPTGDPMFTNENEWGGFQQPGMKSVHYFSRI